MTNVRDVFRRAQRFWRAETGIFLGLWLLLMIGGRSRLFRDPGTFWHTVVGERILSSRRLLSTDPFSFSFGGRPWIAHQWLGECALAAVHRLGQLDSLLLVTVSVLSCLYTWLAHRLIRGGLHWLPTVLVVLLVMGAGALHFSIRPHLATLVFFGWTFACLCDLEAGRTRPGRLVWLVPLCVIWTNTHGGVLGGLATLALALGGWCLAHLLGGQTPLRCCRQALSLSLLFLACGLTVLVNPYGLRLPRAWLEIMGSPLLPRIMAEHAPLDARELEGQLVLLLGLVYAAALAGILHGRPRVTWLVPLVWFGLACSRIRQAPLFGIAAGVALADMLPHTRWALWLGRPGRDWFQLPSGQPQERGSPLAWRPALLPLAVVLAGVLLQAAGAPVPLLGRGWARLDPDYWPADLLPDLQDYEQERPSLPAARGGTPIFNDMLFGGFLIYYTPGLRVFIDDRAELYGDQWLKQYVDAREHDPEQIEQWAREYGFDRALVHTGLGFDRYLETARGWVLVRRGKAATLYRRRTSAAGAGGRGRGHGPGVSFSRPGSGGWVWRS